jgi:hypothetical protein
MNRILAISAISACLLATPASAGSLSDPVIENDLIVADTTATSSVSGMGIVLFLAVLMTAAAAD